MNMLSHQGSFRSVGKISIIHITNFNGHPVIGESVLKEEKVLFIFSCAGSSLLCGPLSSCSEQGLLFS